MAYHSFVLRGLREETMCDMHFSFLWLCGLDHLVGHHALELEFHSLAITLGQKMGIGV